ncbi:hypothetical protein [Chryseolinea lacunae]|uniref:Lipoprotein n=1 Tax=Chryseolinea lacunae TaxID=2801331 RepID=A0ABS1KTS0_9BACT|nr:hypothetical protein [Chryseolinea lacunae]MBL0742588.1 hypothetical protein [Chryseolinea lacunae]
MKSIFYALFILTWIGCRSVSVSPGVTDDCRIFEGEFDVDEYTTPLSMKSPSHGAFIANTENGAFFIQFYLGSGSYRALVLEDEHDQMAVIDLKTGKKSQLSEITTKHAHEALISIQEGSVRQICFNPPSEGSRSVFFVKRLGKIIFKWEAPQHDYLLLNENEKPKVMSALQVIDIMVNNGR